MDRVRPPDRLRAGLGEADVPDLECEMFPNFVAKTTSSRRPAIARATSSSFVYGP